MRPLKVHPLIDQVKVILPTASNSRPQRELDIGFPPNGSPVYPPTVPCYGPMLDSTKMDSCTLDGATDNPQIWGPPPPGSLWSAAFTNVPSPSQARPIVLKAKGDTGPEVTRTLMLQPAPSPIFAARRYEKRRFLVEMVTFLEGPRAGQVEYSMTFFGTLHRDADGKPVPLPIYVGGPTDLFIGGPRGSYGGARVKGKLDGKPGKKVEVPAGRWLLRFPGLNVGEYTLEVEMGTNREEVTLLIQ